MLHNILCQHFLKHACAAINRIRISPINRRKKKHLARYMQMIVPAIFVSPIGRCNRDTVKKSQIVKIYLVEIRIIMRVHYVRIKYL